MAAGKRNALISRNQLRIFSPGLDSFQEPYVFPESPSDRPVRTTIKLMIAAVETLNIGHTRCGVTPPSPVDKVHSYCYSDLMIAKQAHIHTCPNCGNIIEEDQYIMRPDGTYRCMNCYFNDTYLEGVVHHIDMAYLVTLEAFVNAIDAREHEVGNHSLRVTEFSLIISNACDVKGRDLVDLYCGALLHDVGKIGVPDTILHKAGPLNSDEQAVMRKHPDIGFRIIGHIGYFSRAAEIIRSHHEHFDGSGYPRGLKGDAIPHGARVFAVADAIDALTVSRPYRKALTFEETLEEIIKETGTVYDPSVIQAALRASDELKEYVGKIVFSGMDHDHQYGY